MAKHSAHNTQLIKPTVVVVTKITKSKFNYESYMCNFITDFFKSRTELKAFLGPPIFSLGFIT